MQIRGLTLDVKIRDLLSEAKTSGSLIVYVPVDNHLNYRGPLIICSRLSVWGFVGEFISEVFQPLTGNGIKQCRWTFHEIFKINSVVVCESRTKNLRWIPTQEIIDRTIKELKVEYSSCDWDSIAQHLMIENELTH